MTHFQAIQKHIDDIRMYCPNDELELIEARAKAMDNLITGLSDELGQYKLRCAALEKKVNRLQNGDAAVHRPRAHSNVAL